MATQEKSMAAKKFQKSYFDVVGLCCPSEVPLIENILKSLEGIKEFSVIVPTRTVIVVHDNLLISQLQIVKALNQARLEANVRAYGETNHKKKWPSPYAVASGLLLLLSLLKYVWHPFQWLAVAAVAVGILPIILRGFSSLRNCRLDTNILVLIAVIGTIAMKDYVEAGTIVFLFTIAEWLESRASHKANAVMSSLMSIAPQKAVIAETGAVVDVDEVKLNTILAVKAGEVIPIDGIVVDGKCEVDEKTLTGESFPVTKQKDSTVWAGTINLNGYITMKTTALAEDCVVAKMAKLVEEAQNSKSRTQRFIDRCAKYYTPAVIIISTCVAVIPVALGVHNRNHWFHLALVVLVSACPCALILSTPVATFCALTKAATAGLLIKGGDHLETLAKIKVMAFDKTGTITRGEFVVTDFRSLREDISLHTLLYWVSSIESKSSHPMAATLIDHGRSLSIEPKPDDVEEYENFPGEGIYGKIDGKDIYIGNRKIALKAGCETVPTLEGDTKGGKTIGYIFAGATPAGIFNLSDACRSGAAEAIKELKLLGIKTAMLTGDNEAAAMHAQEQLGQALEVVHAELLPKDKARILKEFKRDGPTAMIGDGLNDAPALAIADIGISMGISGSALATETGNVILMSNDLRKVPKAIQLARKAHRKVIENVVLSISTKSAIIALAIAGHPLVWAAVLADTVTCLLVILNSMLLLRGTHNHGGKGCKSSSASHTHEHGCNTKNNHSSHNQKNCCSNSKAQKLCQPQKCSSETCTSRCESKSLNLNSCGNNKCTESAETHDGCAGSGGLHEAKHCGHGSCGMVNHEMGSHNTHHNHGCSPHNVTSCVEDKCSNTIERQGDCEDSDGIHEVNHCEHGSCNIVTPDIVSDSPCNHLSHSTLEDGHQMENNGHCHSIPHGKNHDKNHINNEALEHTANSGCNDHHHHHDHHRSPEVLHNLSKCCTDFNGPHHTIIAIPLGADHVESDTMHACMSLEKSENGGSCRSYMKECCKHGNFGAGFGGGLTEIVTE